MAAMTELKDRAVRVMASDLEEMLEVANAVAWAKASLPDQMAAANAVRRSIHALNRKPSATQLEVIALRYDRLLRTL